MKLLITGGTGYLGSALIHYLGEEHELTIVDNLSTQRYFSLFGLPHPVRFIEADVTRADLDLLFAGQDVIIHLAAITDAVGTANDPARVWWVNLHGTERVADAAARQGCRLVFPSTTSVYGPKEEIVDETCSDLWPQSPYAASKLRAEQYLANLPNLSYVALRCGTIYGVAAGMRFHTALPKWVWEASIGQPLTVWKQALHQVRPYLSIHDACLALLHVLSNNLFPRDVFNVASGNHTPAEIIDHIQHHRPDLRVVETDSPILNLLSYSVSIEKLKKTGWYPVGDLGLGIAQMMGLLQGLRS